MSNICNYTRDPNILTQAKINNELVLIHKHLCYVESQVTNGVLSQVYSTNSAAITFSGLGTQASPLTATIDASAIPTLYAGDGALTSTRTISGNGNSMNFLGLNNLLITCTGSVSIVGGTSPNVLSFNNTGGHLVGTFSVGSLGAFQSTAQLHLGAGTVATGNAPLKFTSGVNLTTAEMGAMEYDGTSLFFTRTPAAGRETVLIGTSGSTPANLPGDSSNVARIFGTTDTSMLSDPDIWIAVVIGGISYRIPGYRPTTTTTTSTTTTTTTT